MPSEKLLIKDGGKNGKKKSQKNKYIKIIMIQKSKHKQKAHLSGCANTSADTAAPGCMASDSVSVMPVRFCTERVKENGK